MASHNLDQQPEELLFTKIKNLEDQLRELRTAQMQGANVVNLKSSGSYTASQSVGSNGLGLWGCHLTSSTGSLIFSTFSFSAYVDEVQDEAHLIGGANTLTSQYQIINWRDWGESTEAGGNYDVSDRIWIWNQSGAAHTIKVVFSWRYIINEGTVSVI